MAREAFLSGEKKNPPEPDEATVHEKFEQLQEDLKKGDKVIPDQREDTGIRISLSHKFRKKDEVAWMSIGLTREEILKDNPVIGDIKVKVISLVEEIKKNFDDAMDLAEPVVTQPTQMQPKKATAAQASGDDNKCPSCGSKRSWITKDHKSGNKDKYGKVKTWSAWSCPNTDPNIDISQRCTQELDFNR